MSYITHGKHLINGQWVDSEKTFLKKRINGEAHAFFQGSTELINHACEAAENAFWQYGYSSISERATFLRTIAEEIEARIEYLAEITPQETGLPEARIRGEAARTTGQLRLFANHIEAGDYLDRRHDVALPNRSPLPRPDLRMMMRPIGPVAVFGASNFPLAFSTAGGDTASALAAGCPVIVKGHEAHPATGEIIAEAIHAAIQRCNIDRGVFAFIHGGHHEIGQALVQHPLIKAVGFTGSLTGGRALFDLCASRAEPIPFFGELGSINPMFVFPHALSQQAQTLGKDWAASLTMGCGQFCTNPGIAIIPTGDDGDAFVQAAHSALTNTPAQTMLTTAISDAYEQGAAKISQTKKVQTHLYSPTTETRQANPALFELSATDWLANPLLQEEVFGPLGIIVRSENIAEMQKLAQSLAGQLTITLQLNEDDEESAQKLLPIIERKAGRLLINGFPTGVEVCDAMVHGGPYPASTNFGATSVGTLAIRRFLRPICYQNFPETLLPKALR